MLVSECGIKFEYEDYQLIEKIEVPETDKKSEKSQDYYIDVEKV